MSEMLERFYDLIKRCCEKILGIVGSAIMLLLMIDSLLYKYILICFSHICFSAIILLLMIDSLPLLLYLFRFVAVTFIKIETNLQENFPPCTQK